MTEPTPTIASPRAVPWTPDMMNPQVPQPAQSQFQQPMSPMQGQPYHPSPSYQFEAQPAAQAYAPLAQHYVQGHAPQAYALAAPIEPPYQAPPQPQHTQMAPVQRVQSQPAQPNYGQSYPERNQVRPPQLHQSEPPPAPQMTVPMEGAVAPQKSKSILAKLLKRSPKPIETTLEPLTPKAASGSLFNKNFALGALTGLVIGAFILPMVLNMFAPETPSLAQVNVGTQPSFDTTQTASEGNTFIDEAIAADAP